MHCQYTSTDTFSDLVAAQQRITNSATFKKFERKLHRAAANTGVDRMHCNPLIVALTFALLWGMALFGVLESDKLLTQLLIIAVLAPVSFGLDRFFYRW